MYKNTTYALIDILKLLLDKGRSVAPRRAETLEAINQVITITSPEERVITTPFRNNNIFSTIVETIWVLSGRNDLEILSHYLPRASDFSDDGKTWRAGYGPRLRSWEGVDQIGEVVRLLTREPESRRAVLVLFDPKHDFRESRDIPCSNWLHFLIRDGLLHMSVVIRSNDVIWGFSGINTFEWSVLHEMMSFWTRTKVGLASYYLGSLHLYGHHYRRAKKIVNHFKNCTLYDYGFSNIKFSTSFDNLSVELEKWWDLESKIRLALDYEIKEFNNIQDEFLRVSIIMVYLFNRHIQGIPNIELGKDIDLLPPCDFRIAAIDYFKWNSVNISELPLSPEEKGFFDDFYH
jgi:thymidylate synthase